MDHYDSKDTHHLLLEDPRIEEVCEVQDTKETEGAEDMPVESSGYIISAIEIVPITQQRPPFQPSSSSQLQNAGTPRANTAPSHECPYGTTSKAWTRQHAQQTVLQQHCTFFDPDHDGIIWPLDTFRGFHALGFGILLSLFAAFIIHANFSYPTLDTWIPDPFFRLYLKNIHMCKHGSDTNTYDHEGRYIPQKFEDVFSKYANGRDWLTIWGVAKMLRGQRCIADLIGWGGAFVECKQAIYSFIHPLPKGAAVSRT
jgi:hypothetical protein